MGNSQPRGKTKKKENVEIERHADTEMEKEAVDKLKTPDEKKTAQTLTDDEAKTKVHLTSAANHLYRYLSFALEDVAKDVVIKAVNDFGKVVTFLEGEYILRAGEDTQGIFIILRGTVEVLVTDNSLAVASLSKGDVFGEISTIFGVQCTANIKVATDVTAVVIESDKAFELFEEHEDALDIIDWCVKHRYFPMGKEIDITRTYRRFALQILKETPVFNFWEEENLKTLILSVPRGLVTLYPPKATLIAADDDIHSTVVITRGIIRITGKGGFSRNIVVSKYSTPFVYGHFSMALVTHFANVTIKAVTDCQVIELENVWIVASANNTRQRTPIQGGPRKFAWFKKCLPHCKPDYAPYFEYELMYHYLKTSEMYKNTSVSAIQWKILNSVSEVCEDGSIVMLGVEKNKYEAVLVLHGTVELRKVAKKTLNNDRSAKDESEVNYNEQTVTDKGNGDIESASRESGLIEMVYNQESVIDITRLDFSQVTLKAKDNTFVCKLPKESKDSQPDPPTKISFVEIEARNALMMEKLKIKTDAHVSEHNARNREEAKPLDDQIFGNDLVQKAEDGIDPKETVQETISKENVKDNKSDTPVESMVDKGNPNPKDADNTEGDNVKLRKGEDTLNKLNERIKKGDKIAKIATEKVDKKRSKIPKKKANELDFV